METSFVAGMVCGALIVGSFAAWLAFCEWSANRWMVRLQRDIDQQIARDRQAREIFDHVMASN